MAKAWMPFYVSDYLGDTGHLDHEEHGVYILAILHYWQTASPLPANAKQLLSICRCFDKAKFEQIWSTVSTFFVLTENGWVHKRIEQELTKAQQISEKRKKAGAEGASKRHSKTIANAEQMPSQSQSQYKTPISPKKKRITSGYSEEFLSFWNEYPQKAGKGKAYGAWCSITGAGDLLPQMLKTLAWQKTSEQWTKDNGQFIPHPTTWLNQKRWEDQQMVVGQKQQPDWMKAY